MLSNKEFKQFRADVDAALASVGEKYGVDIKCGNISYGSNHFDTRLNATKKVVNGVSYEQAEFERVCLIYGFDPEDFGKEFEVQGKTYKLIGFNPKARKKPIIAECEGTRYVFDSNAVKYLMKKN